MSKQTKKQIVLDTNIILRDPSILGKSKEGVELVVTPFVLLELEGSAVHNRSLEEFLQLLRESKSKGIVSYGDLKTDEVLNSNILNIDSVSKRLKSSTDIFLFKYLSALKNQGRVAQLATDDRVLAEAAASAGIDVVGLDRLRQELETPEEPSPEIAAKVKSYLQTQKKYIVINLLVGIGASIASSLLISNISLITSTLPVWGTIISLPVLGVALYWCRSRYRLAYGAAEFIVGLVTSLNIFFPSFDYAHLQPIAVLQILGGLYIMVRGLDNIAQGIRGTKIEPTWKRIFRNE